MFVPCQVRQHTLVFWVRAIIAISTTENENIYVMCYKMAIVRSSVIMAFGFLFKPMRVAEFSVIVYASLLYAPAKAIVVIATNLYRMVEHCWIHSCNRDPAQQTAINPLIKCNCGTRLTHNSRDRWFFTFFSDIVHRRIETLQRMTVMKEKKKTVKTVDTL